MSKWYDRHFHGEFKRCSADDKSICPARARAVALMIAMSACAAVRTEPAATNTGVSPNKGIFMSNPVSAPSHPSPPQIVPIEHGGVRYEQDAARQRRPDAERGGWLVAKDASTGKQL